MFSFQEALSEDGYGKIPLADPDNTHKKQQRILLGGKEWHISINILRIGFHYDFKRWFSQVKYQLILKGILAEA